MKSTKNTLKPFQTEGQNIYLGAGKDKKGGYKSADVYKYKGIDYVFDATGKFPFSNNSIERYFTQDFLEHIPQDKAVHVIKEIHRTLVIGGTMEHIVPNGGSYNDLSSPLHLSHWTIRTFHHFEEGHRRFEKEKELMGWEGRGFEILEQEELTSQNGIPQSIRVILRKI